ncbi:MAG: putative two-component histidine kinase [Lacrimispora sp.]|jgi:sensor histidine kinase YesM|nr:putative two-component histidine kinase [Lacrimispora sp.]
MQISELFMGWFDFIFFFCIMNACLAWLEIWFFGRFTVQIVKWYHYAGYVLVIYLLAAIEIITRTAFPISTLLELGAFFLFGWLVIKCPPAMSGTAAILAICIMQVVNGIFQSLLCIVLTILFPHTMALTVISGLLVMAAVFFSYQLVLKWLKDRNAPMLRYILILILPILFVLLVMQHVFAAYGNTVTISSDGTRTFPVINNWTMLIIQIAAYLSLFAVLYAYKELMEGFALQMRNTLLEQQVNVQTNSVREMQMRYELTRTFRHDLNGHWTVLGGFLKTGETDKAMDYLAKLTTISDQLSFPCQTGNAVLDILLTNKLGIARQKGIRVDCTVKIPGNSIIDDIDLCIVFSNAVDNAIHACSLKSKSYQYLTLRTVQKGDFFMIEIENSRSDHIVPVKGSGIGLQSIKAIAEKYHGTVHIEKSQEVFLLNVLFLIPQQSDSISIQSS